MIFIRKPEQKFQKCLKIDKLNYNLTKIEK
jgi:hypothetical protein